MTKAHRGSSKAATRERNERFVNAYLSKGENATQAYLEIKPGVAANTAATEGYKLLKLPEIQKAVEKRRAEIRSQFALTAERVFEELGRVSYFNPKRLLHPDGRPKTLHELDEGTAAALAAIETEVTGEGVSVTRWRPFDKISALEKVVKILRLYDKPPPPPPDDEGRHGVQDPRETARRMAFLLARGAAADEKALAKPAPKARKKLPVAA